MRKKRIIICEEPFKSFNVYKLSSYLKRWGNKVIHSFKICTEYCQRPSTVLEAGSKARGT